MSRGRSPRKKPLLLASCQPGGIPGPGVHRREDALPLRLQGFLKGTGKRQRLCHRSYKPDLPGLVPYLFMNGGTFPESCLPGVILNSQPFVPRHRPGSGTSAPRCSPFHPERHRAVSRGSGQGQATARRHASMRERLSVSPLLVLARLAGAFQANSCVRCCLMGTLPRASAAVAGMGGTCQPSCRRAGCCWHRPLTRRMWTGCCTQVPVVCHHLQISSPKTGCFKG